MSGHSPLTVALGKMVNNQYEQHQASRQLQEPQIIHEEPGVTQRQSYESGNHFDAINAEILGNIGLAPPSYDTVMDESFTSEKVHRTQSVVSMTSSLSSNSSQTIFTPPTTVYGGDNEEISAQAELDATHVDSKPREWISKKQMKKAHKAARKAEKWARKARARGYVFDL